MYSGDEYMTSLLLNRSYSWSANVCGCKEWLFYPPGEEVHLRDKYGHLPFDVTSADLEDSKLYPNAHRSSGPIRVLQRSGEIIFVPRYFVHTFKNCLLYRIITLYWELILSKKFKECSFLCCFKLWESFH